ncbi:hypothetical protein HDR63_02705 [bacterium]|nr:hypothetical protein [bacterium]
MTRSDIMMNLFSTVQSDRLASPHLLAYLEQHGFFTQVAGPYYGNYSGGLFDHSLAVTRKLLEITSGLKLAWGKSDSPYIIGMFHDLCKIDEYASTMVNDHLEIIPVNKTPEHGAKSVRYLSRLIPLTDEEQLCIRYHMGPYMREDWDGYDDAIKKYETVLWTHTADMYASRLMR